MDLNSLVEQVRKHYVEQFKVFAEAAMGKAASKAHQK